MPIRSVVLSFAMLISPLARAAVSPDVCDARSPHFPGLKVEPGAVDSQIAIDFRRKGPARFKRDDRARVIEIERLWGNGAKTVVPVTSARGRFVGVHLELYLKSPEVSGVGFWSMEFGGFDLFREASWALDGTVLIQPLPAPIEVRRGDRARWASLTVQTPMGIALPAEPSLRFYARTLFHRPWHPKNIAAGSRVDACAYFLFAD